MPVQLLEFHRSQARLETLFPKWALSSPQFSPQIEDFARSIRENEISRF